MSRKSVIFVDAGFLLATGGLRVTGNSLRSAFSVQYKNLVDGIQGFVRERDSRDLLRMYWYDAAKDGLFSDEHKRIGLLPGVKVRMGRMSYNGEQKGVDLKLGLDLVGVARNRSADVAYLLSGDDDLAEAVEAAQDLGMKVVLLGIENQSHRLGVTAVAEHLALQVDDIATLPQTLLDGCFAKSAPVGAAGAGTAAAALRSAYGGADDGAGDAAKTPTPAGLGGRPAALTGVGGVSPRTGEGGAAERSAAEGQHGSEIASGDRTATVPGVAPARPVPLPGPRRVPLAPAGAGAAGFAPAAVRREPVYSTETGAPPAASPWFDLLESAEAVAVSLADNWHGSVTERELAELLAERPLLPPNIDRVLIKDCAAKIGEAKTDLQDIRKALRAAFWRRLDELIQ